MMDEYSKIKINSDHEVITGNEFNGIVRFIAINKEAESINANVHWKIDHDERYFEFINPSIQGFMEGQISSLSKSIMKRVKWKFGVDVEQVIIDEITDEKKFSNPSAFPNQEIHYASIFIIRVKINGLWYKFLKDFRYCIGL